MKIAKEFLLEKFDYIQEYIDNNLIDLKKYINMTEEEKQEDLIELFKNIFPLWFWNSSYIHRLPKIKEKIGGDIKDKNVDKIFEFFPDIRHSFGLSLYSMVMKDYGEDLHTGYGVPYNRMPSWIFFDKGNSEIIKNQWLIHFTKFEDAKNIAKTGFSMGTSDMKRLGLTYQRTADKGLGGYNFAYTLDDYEKYGSRDGGIPYKYGNSILMFKASGVKFWHKTDTEPQVIFWGNYARDIIPIIPTYDKDFRFYVMNQKTKKKIVQSKTLPEMVDWIQQNFNQYKDVLVMI